MIVTCTNCEAPFHSDNAQPIDSPAAYCPNCYHHLSSSSRGSLSTTNGSALGAGNSPATQHRQSARPIPAPAYKLESVAKLKSANGHASQETGNADEKRTDPTTLLAAFLQQTIAGSIKRPEAATEFASWKNRRALLCVAPEHVEAIAHNLTEAGYEVFVADNAPQATGRMREDHMDVVVVDTEFDEAEQGAAFVTGAVSALQLAERRRLFLVQISPTARTYDSHAAFVDHVNLTVNAGDIGDFAPTLDRALRYFAELYRDFNKALSLRSL